MNQRSAIDKLNETIGKIRHNDYTDADVATLIDLSPGHYMDLALKYKVLESPHRTHTAFKRALAMMDDRNHMVDYFLHRFAKDHYDSLLFPLLKMPGEEKLIQDMADRAVGFTKITGLVGKVVQLSNRFKTTQRLTAASINEMCAKIGQKPSSFPDSQLWAECRRAAQVRETLLALPEHDITHVDSTHKKSAVFSIFIRSFFEDLRQDDLSQIKKLHGLFSLPLHEIQDSFNLAFSLTREHFEGTLKQAGTGHTAEKIRNDIHDASEKIRAVLKEAFGINLDKPRRILNALDIISKKPASSSARTEALAIN